MVINDDLLVMKNGRVGTCGIWMAVKRYTSGINGGFSIFRRPNHYKLWIQLTKHDGFDLFYHHTYGFGGRFSQQPIVIYSFIYIYMCLLIYLLIYLSIDISMRYPLHFHWIEGWFRCEIPDFWWGNSPMQCRFWCCKTGVAITDGPNIKVCKARRFWDRCGEFGWDLWW